MPDMVKTTVAHYASPKKKHMLSFNFLFGAFCLRQLCYNKMLHLYFL